MSNTSGGLGRRFWLLNVGWLIVVGVLLVRYGADGLSSKSGAGSAVYLLAGWSILGWIVGAMVVPAVDELVATSMRTLRRLRHRDQCIAPTICDA